MKIHEIEKCLQEVIKECHHLNIPISKQIDPKIRINKRAKSRFAACMKDKRFQDPVFVIEIGNALLEIDEKKVRSILAHEVLHTCYDCKMCIRDRSYKTIQEQLAIGYDIIFIARKTIINSKDVYKRQLDQFLILN